MAVSSTSNGSGLLHFGDCFLQHRHLLIFYVMQETVKNTASPVQTENEQNNDNSIISRVLKNQSINNLANAKIRKHYKKQKKEVIINDLIHDFQEKYDYVNFVSELGLSEVFESWKILSQIRKEVSNG